MMDYQGRMLVKVLFVFCFLIVVFFLLLWLFFKWITKFTKDLDRFTNRLLDESFKQEDFSPKQKCPKCGEMVEDKEKSDADKLYDDLSKIFGTYLDTLIKIDLELKEKLDEFLLLKFIFSDGKKQSFLEKVCIIPKLFSSIIIIFLVIFFLVLVFFLISFMQGFSIIMIRYNNNFFPWLLPKLYVFEEKRSKKLLSVPTIKTYWGKLRNYKFFKNLVEIPKTPPGFLFKIIKFIFWVIILDIITGKIALWNVVCILLGIFLLFILSTLIWMLK